MEEFQVMFKGEQGKSTKDDVDNTVFNLLQDIKYLKECINELAEADCMGEISKILRQYGYK